MTNVNLHVSKQLQLCLDDALQVFGGMLPPKKIGILVLFGVYLDQILFYITFRQITIFFLVNRIMIAFFSLIIIGRLFPFLGCPPQQKILQAYMITTACLTLYDRGGGG